MRRIRISVVWVSMFCCVAVAHAQSQGVTDKQVSDAITKGVDFLYKQQNPWGHWDVQNAAAGKNHEKSQFGGWTALVLDALFSCGEEYQGNKKIQTALDFLSKTDPGGTYATGLRAHVWPQLPDQFLDYLKTDAYRLEQALSEDGTYRYELKPQKGWDNSCTQYGVLGAWECQKRGVPISNAYWTRVEKHFMDSQNGDGGWGYTGGNTTQNMAAAGLACLAITENYLHYQEFVRPGVAENHPVHKSIEKGVKWFDQNFDAFEDKKSKGDAYGMVGVERVGLASGRKYFKGKDWYRAGAEVLIRGQGANGQMGSKPGGPVISTAFSLIFLSRGRVPTFINKLEIPDYPWCNRPRDMANLAAWASDELEIHMNWQVVGIDRDPSDWMDAPILYLASHRPLELDDANVAKLKRYLDMGGLLVCNADASSRQFVDSVTKIFESVYPYKFKPISADDPLMNLVYPLRESNALVLNNGVRHMVIILTRDPASEWQVDNQRDMSSWQLMGNIFQYAVEKTQPRNRLEILAMKQTNDSKTKVAVARAKYEGNWNPEPYAWRAQRIFDNNQQKANPQVQTLDLKDIGDADVSLVHVAGTDTTRFTDDQVQAVRDFVKKGGVILFETAGGQPAFTESVRRMLAKALPDHPIRRLSPVSPIITGTDIDGAFNNTRVDYRVFYKQRLGVSNQPSLQAITIDDQPRVIVSAEDMSNAMLGRPVWGIFGYDTASARKLMTNILLYARKVHPAEGKAPAPEPEEKDAEDKTPEPAATE